MGIGEQINAFFLDLAVNLSLAVFGVACFVTVLAGLFIFFSFGGSGLQKHLKDWFLQMLVGVFLTGGFQILVRAIQSHMVLGAPAAPAAPAAMISMLVGAWPF